MHTEKQISFTLNGKSVQAAEGISVAAAVLNQNVTAFRRSVTGQPRGPLCGMGICFECRLSIDGQAHQKSCQVPLVREMVVVTDE
jgi:sarcosine oxidase subunit alpha